MNLIQIKKINSGGTHLCIKYQAYEKETYLQCIFPEPADRLS
jgi:hypothetical protein